MRPRSYRWMQVPAQVYADVYKGMPADRAWFLYACSTNVDTPHPCDQSTEWSLDGESCPLLRNQTLGGVHSYYIAQPIEVDE